MFSLTCRETGIPASVRLRIQDEVLGLDIDNAVTLRLLRWDGEVKKNDRQALAYEVCKMAFGTKEDDDSILDSSTLHPLVAADKYADENTIIS